ncbi:MAG: PP2C family protein-serine/threonine phosphatase [Methanosarcinaceae archaeon]
MNDEIKKLTEKVSRLQSLIHVTAIISSVLDLEKLMQLVMDKAQSVMQAEASSILLLNEESGMLECEIALGSVGEQVKQKVKLKLGQGIGGWVAATGKPLIVADVSNDSRFDAKSDQRTGFKTRSILAVPLIAKDKIIGVAEVLNPVDGRTFTEDDLDLFITFSQQVALAIENAKAHRYMLEKQKLEQQLDAAHTIQQSFMVQSFPQSADGSFSVWAKNLPAKSIGGDFYDFIRFKDENRLGIIIGDVSGKGIPAALYMARLVSDFRYYSLAEKTISACLEKINNSLVSRSRRGMFVTVAYSLLDISTGKLSIINGGHLPFLWYHQKSDRTEIVENLEGIPLGIQSGVKFSPIEIRLEPGDYLIFFTDGVIEAKNVKGQQFSMKRLVANVDGTRENPEKMVQHILNQIDEFSEKTPRHDDTTIVALRWH